MGKFILTLKNNIPIEEWPLSNYCIAQERNFIFFTMLFNQIDAWPYNRFKGISAHKYNMGHGSESIIWFVIINEILTGNIDFIQKDNPQSQNGKNTYFLLSKYSTSIKIDSGIIENTIQKSFQSDKMEIKEFTKVLSKNLMGFTVWNSLAHNFLIRKLIKEEIRFWTYNHQWKIPLLHPIFTTEVKRNDAIHDVIESHLNKIGEDLIAKTKDSEFSNFCINLYTNLLISTSNRTSTVA